MVAHVNFYEDIPEAQKRLNNTVVLYEGKPYYVLAISNHKADGKFRIYLDALRDSGPIASKKYPMPYSDYGDGTVGPAMDVWIAANPDKGVIRKHMDSPHFNKYRPFPLGMCNYADNAFYVERSPTRHTQQGLTGSMMLSKQLSVVPDGVPRSNPINLMSNEFYRTIVNDYPSPEECLSVLSNSDYSTRGAAFHRQFAFLAGPMSIVFLAYKDNVVGMLPTGDLSKVRIDKSFKHTIEVIQELGLFGEVDVIK